MGRFQSELIYYFTYFSTFVTSNSCVFLFSRPFIVNTFSTGLVMLKFILSPGLGSWQLEFKSLIIIIVCFQNFVYILVWTVYLGIQIYVREEVCILGHFVLRWHHWAGFRRRPLIVFRSLQLCLFFYGCFLGVLWT